MKNLKYAYKLMPVIDKALNRCQHKVIAEIDKFHALIIKEMSKYHKRSILEMKALCVFVKYA